MALIQRGEKSVFQWSTQNGNLSLGTMQALFGGRGDGSEPGTSELVEKAGFRWELPDPPEKLVDSITEVLVKERKLDDQAKLAWHKAHARGNTVLSLEEWHEGRQRRYAALFARGVALVELGATGESLNATFRRFKAAGSSLSPRERVKERLLRTLFPAGVPDGGADILLVDEDNKLRQRAAGKANHLRLGGFGPRSFGAFQQATAAALPAAAAPALPAAPAAPTARERLQEAKAMLEDGLITEDQFAAVQAKVVEQLLG